MEFILQLSRWCMVQYTSNLKTYFCLSWTNTGELKADSASNVPVQFCFWDNNLQKFRYQEDFRQHNLTLPDGTLLNHCLSLVIFWHPTHWNSLTITQNSAILELTFGACASIQILSSWTEIIKNSFNSTAFFDQNFSLKNLGQNKFCDL